MKTVNEASPTTVDNASPALSPQEINRMRFGAQSTELDLKSLSLSDADMQEILEVKEKFGENTSVSVAEFGKDISSRNHAGELLALVSNKDLDETGDKLNQIVTVAKNINSANLISNKSGWSKLPIIGPLFKGFDNAKQKFEMSFNSTEQQIGSLIDEIEKNQIGLKKRVELLDGMFASVTDEHRSLGVYVAAGKLKLQDIQAEINELAPHAQTDQAANQKMYDLNHVYNNLEKRIHDLFILQQSAMQTLPSIRIIQSNNIMLIDKFFSIKNITVPSWKNQIALAISLNEQRNSVQLANSIDDATNELLKRNAELLHRNSIDTARANQRSIIDTATLETVQNTLIRTVNEVIQIQHEGAKKREEATVKLKSLQENYKKIVSTDTMRIASKQK